MDWKDFTQYLDIFRLHVHSIYVDQLSSRTRSPFFTSYTTVYYTLYIIQWYIHIVMMMNNAHSVNSTVKNALSIKNRWGVLCVCVCVEHTDECMCLIRMN